MVFFGHNPFGSLFCPLEVPISTSQRLRLGSLEEAGEVTKGTIDTECSGTPSWKKNCSRQAWSMFYRLQLGWKVKLTNFHYTAPNGDQLTIPYISPKDILPYLMKHHPDLVIGGLDSACERSLHLEAFWEAYRIKHPTHEVFCRTRGQFTEHFANLLARGWRTGQTSWQYSSDFNRDTNRYTYIDGDEETSKTLRLCTTKQFEGEVWKSNKTIAKSFQTGFITTKNNNDWPFVLTTLGVDHTSNCHLQIISWSDQRDASCDWKRVQGALLRGIWGQWSDLLCIHYWCEGWFKVVLSSGKLWPVIRKSGCHNWPALLPWVPCWKSQPCMGGRGAEPLLECICV